MHEPSPTDPEAAWSAPDTPNERLTSSSGFAQLDDSVPEGSVRVPVPLRPMTVADKIDGAFMIVKQRPRLILGFTAVITLPIQVVAAYASRGQLGGVFDISTNPSFGTVFAESTGGWSDIVLAYVDVLPLVFIGAFLARLVGGWYAGHEPTAADLRGALLRSTPALLLAWVVVHLAETAATVGVLFIMPLFLVVGPVIGAEGIGGWAALRRSWRLGTSAYWPAFAVVVLSGLLTVVLDVAFGFVPTLGADLLGPDRGWVLLAVGNGLSALVVAPIVSGAAVLHYLDARMRTEGLDLELRAMAAFGTAGA